MKLGRNDPCWCRSGKKYKKCHLNREQEQKLPFEAIKDGINKNARLSKCLHPQASKKTCSKIVSAHTIQRSRLLKTIADKNNHILSFYPPEPDKEIGLKVHKIGWKKAATFNAFCGYHDDVTFAPLEKNEFVGNEEQIFLIAYRAICWELYQKERISLAYPSIQTNIDRGRPEFEQRKIQEMINAQILGTNKGIKNLKSIKSKMDKVLLARLYGAYESYEVILSGKSVIAATGAIAPTFSLGGSRLQVLHDPNSNIQWLSFGIDVRSDDSISIVFLWHIEHSISRGYIRDLNSLPDKKLSEFLIQFFFAYCENTYFSVSWWNSLSRKQKNKVIELTKNANPSYYQPNFDFSFKLAPWKIYKKIFS